nr:hypothetical protein C4D60_Mb01t27480 [Ipomoea batatas]
MIGFIEQSDRDAIGNTSTCNSGTGARSKKFIRYNAGTAPIVQARVAVPTINLLLNLTNVRREFKERFNHGSVRRPRRRMRSLSQVFLVRGMSRQCIHDGDQLRRVRLARVANIDRLGIPSLKLPIIADPVEIWVVMVHVCREIFKIELPETLVSRRANLHCITPMSEARLKHALVIDQCLASQGIDFQSVSHVRIKKLVDWMHRT